MQEVSVVGRTDDDAPFSSQFSNDLHRVGRANLAQRYLANSYPVEGYTRTFLSSRGRHPTISEAMFFFFFVRQKRCGYGYRDRLARDSSGSICYSSRRMQLCSTFVRASKGIGKKLDLLFFVPIFQAARVRCIKILSFLRLIERIVRGKEKNSFLEYRVTHNANIRFGSWKIIGEKALLCWMAVEAIEERINSKTNLGRFDVRLNAIGRFIFNLLAEESPSMQFKRTRRISFQTRNDDFLFDGRR